MAKNPNNDYLRKAKKNIGNPEPIPSIKNLSREMPTMDEWGTMDREIEKAHDMSVAILLVSHVERFVEFGIIARLNRKDQSTINQLVSRGGPIPSFSSKIILAYAMGLISKDDKNDMEALKSIRNVFAHSSRHLTFDTAVISKQIQSMVCVKTYNPSQLSNPILQMVQVAIPMSRKMFIYACKRLCLNVLSQPLKPEPQSVDNTQPKANRLFSGKDFVEG